MRAESPTSVVNELVTSFPPVVATYEGLDEARQAEMRGALEDCFRRYQQPDGQVSLDRPYLLQSLKGRGLVSSGVKWRSDEDAASSAVLPGGVEGSVFIHRQLGEAPGAEFDPAEISRVGDERMLATRIDR
jgi:hypothetical protein